MIYQTISHDNFNNQNNQYSAQIVQYFLFAEYIHFPILCLAHANSRNRMTIHVNIIILLASNIPCELCFLFFFKSTRKYIKCMTLCPSCRLNKQTMLQTSSCQIMFQKSKIEPRFGSDNKQCYQLHELYQALYGSNVVNKFHTGIRYILLQCLQTNLAIYIQQLL